jgi:enoyl-CoA hydratase/carnithine racemase
MTTRAVDTGTEQMLAHVEDGIGWITYNNPARHNAMSFAMQLAVPRILEAFTVDPDVHVVVVRGAGDKAFVSGADISEFESRRTAVDARAEYDAALHASWGAWRSLPKPVIAMIRGYCIGGGLLTAMKADIRIAADDSQFAIPAARLGLGYAIEGVRELRDLVGPAHAAELLFSAHRIGAEEALAIGLVNRVVPVGELHAVVSELAATIATNAPLTVKACKAALRELAKDPAQRDLEHVEVMIEGCFRSDDYREGQRAFVEKRPPRFTGR